VYDKFHIMQHANDAIDEARRAEFVRHGKAQPEVITGKTWLPMSRWKNLSSCMPKPPFGVAYRTEVFENTKVKGGEFLRKVKAVARRNKLRYRWAPERGSGSHGTLYVGARFTVVKDLKKELAPGLLSDMLKQIGIRKEDL
jgi:predicted RNA binding protein YcfA (HicA-like mRNA interferase family)